MTAVTETEAFEPMFAAHAQRNNKKVSTATHVHRGHFKIRHSHLSDFSWKKTKKDKRRIKLKLQNMREVRLLEEI